MAGRGRGRGRGGSNLPSSLFPSEPLLGPVLEPPPLYPLTDKKPKEIECNDDTEYLLLINRELTDHYNEMSEFIDSPEPLNAPTDSSSYKTQKPVFLWTHVPAELRPKAKTRTIRVKQNITNVGEVLNRLEKLEKKVDKSADGEGDNEDESKEVEDFDEEMDDGTDYANDYFDNGEQYEDNDDGDTGPVY